MITSYKMVLRLTAQVLHLVMINIVSTFINKLHMKVKLKQNVQNIDDE